MKNIRIMIVLAVFYLSPACTDYATFGTSTNIGINADTNTQTLSIGFDRAEFFAGPGYPETGEALESASYFGSNLSPFTPKIHQLYATGDAAGLATQYTLPIEDPEKPEPYYGTRRLFVFGTGSNLGLKIGFAGGMAPMPSSIKFGYNREELSIIPLQASNPAKVNPDQYASVLASVNMDLSSPSLPDTSLKLTQFFATGAAARNLAKRPMIRTAFENQAVLEADKATVQAWENTLTSEREKIKEYFTAHGGYSASNRDTLLKATRLRIPPDLQQAATEDEFFKLLDRHFMLVHPLASAAGG